MTDPKTFHDLFVGKGIILDTDGMAIGDGAVGTGAWEPRKATHPCHIRYFDSFEEAMAFCRKHCPDGYTAHRVERLEVLQEKFSY